MIHITCSIMLCRFARSKGNPDDSGHMEPSRFSARRGCGLSLRLGPVREPNESKRPVEFVGTAESIDVYRTEARGKQKVQSLGSRRPSSLTLDVTGRYLFAVNEIDTFQGLPTGSVESYAVDPGSGHLTLISRKPLSLSATMPTGLALSPDGRVLVVAVYGGGLYNVASCRFQWRDWRRSLRSLKRLARAFTGIGNRQHIHIRSCSILPAGFSSVPTTVQIA